MKSRGEYNSGNGEPVCLEHWRAARFNLDIFRKHVIPGNPIKKTVLRVKTMVEQHRSRIINIRVCRIFPSFSSDYCTKYVFFKTISSYDRRSQRLKGYDKYDAEEIL